MENMLVRVLCREERLRIIQALSKGPLPLSALRTVVGGNFSSLLHHVRALQQAGLVEVVRLRPRLTVAYLKFDVKFSFEAGSGPTVELKPREPPAESELMMAYWRLLVRR
jgi:DNA-binding transcriptional ArsR family regulator